MADARKVYSSLENELPIADFVLQANLRVEDLLRNILKRDYHTGDILNVLDLYYNTNSIDISSYQKLEVECKRIIKQLMDRDRTTIIIDNDSLYGVLYYILGNCQLMQNKLADAEFTFAEGASYFCEEDQLKCELKLSHIYTCLCTDVTEAKLLKAKKTFNDLNHNIKATAYTGVPQKTLDLVSAKITQLIEPDPQVIKQEFSDWYKKLIADKKQFDDSLLSNKNFNFITENQLLIFHSSRFFYFLAKYLSDKNSTESYQKMMRVIIDANINLHFTEIIKKIISEINKTINKRQKLEKLNILEQVVKDIYITHPHLQSHYLQNLFKKMKSEYAVEPKLKINITPEIFFNTCAEIFLGNNEKKQKTPSLSKNLFASFKLKGTCVDQFHRLNKAFVNLELEIETKDSLLKFQKDCHTLFQQILNLDNLKLKEVSQQYGGILAALSYFIGMSEIAILYQDHKPAASKNSSSSNANSTPEEIDENINIKYILEQGIYFGSIDKSSHQLKNLLILIQTYILMSTAQGYITKLSELKIPHMEIAGSKDLSKLLINDFNTYKKNVALNKPQTDKGMDIQNLLMDYEKHVYQNDIDEAFRVKHSLENYLVNDFNSEQNETFHFLTTILYFKLRLESNEENDTHYTQPIIEHLTETLFYSTNVISCYLRFVNTLSQLDVEEEDLDLFLEDWNDVLANDFNIEDSFFKKYLQDFKENAAAKIAAAEKKQAANLSNIPKSEKEPKNTGPTVSEDKAPETATTQSKKKKKKKKNKKKSDNQVTSPAATNNQNVVSHSTTLTSSSTNLQSSTSSFGSTPSSLAASTTSFDENLLSGLNSSTSSLGSIPSSLNSSTSSFGNSSSSPVSPAASLHVVPNLTATKAAASGSRASSVKSKQILSSFESTPSSLASSTSSFESTPSSLNSSTSSFGSTSSSLASTATSLPVLPSLTSTNSSTSGSDASSILKSQQTLFAPTPSSNTTSLIKPVQKTEPAGKEVKNEDNTKQTKKSNAMTDAEFLTPFIQQDGLTILSNLFNATKSLNSSLYLVGSTAPKWFMKTELGFQQEADDIDLNDMDFRITVKDMASFIKLRNTLIEDVQYGFKLKKEDFGNGYINLRKKLPNGFKLDVAIYLETTLHQHANRNDAHFLDMTKGEVLVEFDNNANPILSIDETKANNKAMCNACRNRSCTVALPTTGYFPGFGALWTKNKAKYKKFNFTNEADVEPDLYDHYLNNAKNNTLYYELFAFIKKKQLTKPNAAPIIKLILFHLINQANPALENTEINSISDVLLPWIIEMYASKILSKDKYTFINQIKFMLENYLSGQFKDFIEKSLYRMNPLYQNTVELNAQNILIASNPNGIGTLEFPYFTQMGFYQSPYLHKPPQTIGAPIEAPKPHPVPGMPIEPSPEMRVKNEKPAINKIAEAKKTKKEKNPINSNASTSTTSDDTKSSKKNKHSPFNKYQFSVYEFYLNSLKTSDDVYLGLFDLMRRNKVNNQNTKQIMKVIFTAILANNQSLTSVAELQPKVDQIISTFLRLNNDKILSTVKMKFIKQIKCLVKCFLKNDDYHHLKKELSDVNSKPVGIRISKQSLITSTQNSSSESQREKFNKSSNNFKNN